LLTCLVIEEALEVPVVAMVSVRWETGGSMYVLSDSKHSKELDLRSFENKCFCY